MTNNLDLEKMLEVVSTCIKHGFFERAEQLAFAVETYAKTCYIDGLAKKAVLMRAQAYTLEGEDFLEQGEPEKAVQMYSILMSYAEEEKLPEIIGMLSNFGNKIKTCTPSERVMRLLQAGEEGVAKASYLCFIGHYSAAYNALNAALRKYNAVLQTAPFELQIEAAKQIYGIEDQLIAILSANMPIPYNNAKVFVN